MWGNDLLSGGETQLIYVNSPAAISLLLLWLLSLYQPPTHACTPSPSFLISLIIPHQKRGGGGCRSYRGGCPLPPNIRTQSAGRISAFFLSCVVVVLIHYGCTRRTNATAAESGAAFSCKSTDVYSKT